MWPSECVPACIAVAALPAHAAQALAAHHRRTAIMCSMHVDARHARWQLAGARHSSQRRAAARRAASGAPRVPRGASYCAKSKGLGPSGPALRTLTQFRLEKPAVVAAGGAMGRADGSRPRVDGFFLSVFFPS